MSIRAFAREMRFKAYALLAMVKRPRRGRPHGLPGELVVSLTSYPPRFPTLPLTLACLFDQTIQPDRIILWIAHGDMAQLPFEINRYRAAGLDIRSCEDIGPYKKLIPTLEALPDAFIITADDDVFYRRDWLETLVADPDGAIACTLANRVKRNPDGSFAPYLEWEFNVSDGEIMPVGAGGVLYPPHSLHPDATDRIQFMSLCPTGDDLWYWHMAKKAGSKFRKAGGRSKLMTWPGSQEKALWNHNASANDRMLRKLVTGLAQSRTS